MVDFERTNAPETMTFEQIKTQAEMAGLTITGNRHGWQVHGIMNRFGRPYTAEFVNTASLFGWAKERFG